MQRRVLAMAAIGAAMAAALKPTDADKGVTTYRAVEPEPSKRGHDRPPPRPRPESTPPVMTEADNTRLRLAAEKRSRKAARQAKGMTVNG